MSKQIDECEHCGRPAEVGSKMTLTGQHGWCCVDCVEEQPWKDNEIEERWWQAIR